MQRGVMVGRIIAEETPKQKRSPQKAMAARRKEDPRKGDACRDIIGNAKCDYIIVKFYDNINKALDKPAAVK